MIRPMRIVFWIGMGLLLVAGFILFVYFGAFGHIPDEKELKSMQTEQASLVYSEDDAIIGKYFVENRIRVRWEELPEHLIQALIATEDKRFLDHSGLDFRSYFRVFFRTILLRDKSGGGGSTLTQQIVKNLYGRKEYRWLEMPINKTREAIIAARMETIYSKEELLQLYLNTVPFGEDIYGVETAALRFFNKPTRKLSIDESAVLVGMLKANTYFNPRMHPQRSIERRNRVLDLMANESYISQEKAEQLKQRPLGLQYENPEQEQQAGYFVYQVRKEAETLLKKKYPDVDLERDGLRIHTTLNYKLHLTVVDAARKHMQKMQGLLDQELKQSKGFERFKKEHPETHPDQLRQAWADHKALQAAVLITNPNTGAILSWQGGNDFKQFPYDLVRAKTQAASAFKPFLYATALESGFTPCDYLENKETIYEDYDDWAPRNFDGRSTPDSLVSLWAALSQSLNLPSIDLYFKLDKSDLKHSLKQFGFPYALYDNPSIALGAIEVSLYEMVRAYGVFATLGQRIEPYMIEKITDSDANVLYQHNVETEWTDISAETCAQMTALLQGVIQRGTGTRIRNTYHIQSDLAGKTGTASDYSNAWFMAYTPNLVLGVWSGARTQDVRFRSAHGTGSSLALPVLGDVLASIEKSTTMRQKYLRPFQLSEDYYTFADCPVYQLRDDRSFFERLFQPNPADKQPETAQPEPKQETEAPPKEESRIKRLLKDLFRR
ncbi:MAG: transglycosylase domain-containing protein [Bacteroidales bacterium]|nr:transglycosylase domain-containing protein [Bacteroidales bacterium]MDD4770911.1 transglycosylase domain-containing protein [Bacteroidales bacterium]